jgi:hypothetical protein
VHGGDLKRPRGRRATVPSPTPESGFSRPSVRLRHGAYYCLFACLFYFFSLLVSDASTKITIAENEYARKIILDDGFSMATTVARTTDGDGKFDLVAHLCLVGCRVNENY